VERVIKVALDHYALVFGLPVTRGMKAEPVITIDVVAHEAMWAAAIEAELRVASLEASVEILPVIQSVADDVLGKVGLSIGYTPTPSDLRLHNVRVRDLARSVTGINQTTKDRVSRTVRNAINDGQNVRQVADTIRDRIPQIAENRTMTIARTEMGRATDQATLFAMQQSGVVTHVSVIGCQAIERNAPHLLGIPTCNIQNVPIDLEGDLSFHINHTGSIVPSGFRREDGGTPELTMRPGGPYDS
jgi:hypothetical protein